MENIPLPWYFYLIFLFLLTGILSATHLMVPSCWYIPGCSFFASFKILIHQALTHLLVYWSPWMLDLVSRWIFRCIMRSFWVFSAHILSISLWYLRIWWLARCIYSMDSIFPLKLAIQDLVSYSLILFGCCIAYLFIVVLLLENTKVLIADQYICCIPRCLFYR